MAVLIDPPVWPAHGTLFSHLVSDASLEELHAFARRSGLSERAFDQDHYDTPERSYRALVEAGADPVSGKELTSRLRASGLRVPARDRLDRIEPRLRAAFSRLLPEYADVGEDLITRWREPHRYYHDLRHLRHALESIDLLIGRSDVLAGGVGEETVKVARLAAWWHDAIYAGQHGEDERASAELAGQQLDGVVPPGVRQRVMDVILCTADHCGTDDPASSLLLDADLAVLARPAAAYQRYVMDVRREYAHVSDQDFAMGRTRVLSQLIEAPRLFITTAGRQFWEEKARANVHGELKALKART